MTSERFYEKPHVSCPLLRILKSQLAAEFAMYNHHGADFWEILFEKFW